MSLFERLFVGSRRADDDPTTGDWVPEARTWDLDLLAMMTTPERDAILETLIFTARADGLLSDGERSAIMENVREFAQAHDLSALDVDASIAAADARVQAALAPQGYRNATRESQHAAAVEVARSVAARIASRATRRELFRCVVRLARGSGNDVEAADRVVLAFGQALGLDEAAL